MTNPFGSTTETYDQVGIREDLTELIYDVSPTETPALMMFERGTASQTRHDWQMDILEAADVTNAQIEGLIRDATGDFDTLIPTVRPFNFTQISARAITVTGSAEAANTAGRASELSYQLAKKSKELKRDLEAILFANRVNAPGSTGVPRLSCTVVTAFSDTELITGGTAIPGAHVSRDGSTEGGFGGATWAVEGGASNARALLESDLKGVIQGTWENGGDPTILLTGAFLKTVISSFTGNSTRFDKGEDQRLYAAIDVYISDFGEHRCVPSRFVRNSDVYCLTPELWRICYFRPFRQHALAKDGDAEKRVVLVEWCLEPSNQSASGLVADCATS